MVLERAQISLNLNFIKEFKENEFGNEFVEFSLECFDCFGFVKFEFSQKCKPSNSHSIEFEIRVVILIEFSSFEKHAQALIFGMSI